MNMENLKLRSGLFGVSGLLFLSYGAAVGVNALTEYLSYKRREVEESKKAAIKSEEDYPRVEEPTEEGEEEEEEDPDWRTVDEPGFRIKTFGKYMTAEAHEEDEEEEDPDWESEQEEPLPDGTYPVGFNANGERMFIKKSSLKREEKEPVRAEEGEEEEEEEEEEPHDWHKVDNPLPRKSKKNKKSKKDRKRREDKRSIDKNVIKDNFYKFPEQNQTPPTPTNSPAQPQYASNNNQKLDVKPLPNESYLDLYRRIKKENERRQHESLPEARKQYRGDGTVGSRRAYNEKQSYLKNLENGPPIRYFHRNKT